MGVVERHIQNDFLLPGGGEGDVEEVEVVAKDGEEEAAAYKNRHKRGIQVCQGESSSRNFVSTNVL